MKKIVTLITINLLFQVCVYAQSYNQQPMDTIKIKNTLIKIVNAFKEKSFDKCKLLLVKKNNYLELSKLMRGELDLEENLLNQAFKQTEEEAKAKFNEVLAKGESKGINWEKVSFEGFVCNSEEIIIGNETKSKGFLVDNHIRINYGGKKYTIIGIQLWLFDNEYKLKGDELRGIFEIDLDVYVSAEDMYLDEMEDDGY